MSTGILKTIWIKRGPRGVMDPRPSATLVAGRGIVGNVQGGRRQVTVISEERWAELTRELRAEVDPRARRANLLVSGLDLEGSTGKILRIGACRVRLLGGVPPCVRMEEAHPGLQDAMRPHWGGGAYGEVLDDGVIAVGDAVELLSVP